MSIELQFHRMKRILEMDGGDSYTKIRMCLILPNFTLKNDSGHKFYVLCIFTTTTTTKNLILECIKYYQKRKYFKECLNVYLQQMHSE